MLDCPKCGALAYDGTTCSACRFVAGGKRAASVPRDPLHGVCDFISEGMRCAELGTISPGRRGEGPWYCWKHYSLVVMGRREEGASGAVPGAFLRIKDLLAAKFRKDAA